MAKGPMMAAKAKPGVPAKSGGFKPAMKGKAMADMATAKKPKRK